MAWHSKTSDVYHKCISCRYGKEIEDKYLVPDSTGEKRLCKMCRMIRTAGACREAPRPVSRPQQE